MAPDRAGTTVAGEDGDPHPPAIHRGVRERDVIRVTADREGREVIATGEVVDGYLAHGTGFGRLSVKFVPLGELAPFLMESTWDSSGWGPVHLYEWATDGYYSRDYSYRYRGEVSVVVKDGVAGDSSPRAVADGGVITSGHGILSVLDVIRVLEPGDRVRVNDRTEPMTVTEVYDGNYGEGDTWSLYVDLDGSRGGVYGLSYCHGVEGGVPATLINKKGGHPAPTEDVTELALVERATPEEQVARTPRTQE